MNAVTTRNLGKKYEIYRRPLNRMAEWLTLGKARLHDDFWALRGLSLELKPGRTLGILGANGAGKSTLLKLLGGISQPSEGTIELNGRVTGLLELGAGFHPEFTGRDNAIMSCSLLGMGRAEIRRKLDEIVGFSEIGDFIDRPVKTYSSGMYMRLGFSVATCVDPDILLVDEALSVGDEYFVNKCTRRFDELRKRGKTIILVTHLIKNIRLLCDEAVLIERGRLVSRGEPGRIADEYMGMVTERWEQSGRALSRRSEAAPSAPAEIEFDEIEILDRNGNRTERLTTGAPFSVRGRYRVRRDLEMIIFGLDIFREDGTKLISHHPLMNDLFETDWKSPHDLYHRAVNKKAGDEGCVTCRFDYNPLLGGAYFACLQVTQLRRGHLPRLALEATRPAYFAVAPPPGEMESQFHCKANWEDSPLK